MNEPIKGPPVLQECWEGFRHLLHIIETLFGDLFDAPAWVRREEALEALRWIRDAETAARALLLAMAKTIAVVLAPLRGKTRAAGTPASPARTPAQSRFALLTGVRRKATVRVHRTATPRLAAARAEQRAEDGYNWRMFARPPAGALERLEDCPPFYRVETKGEGEIVRVRRTADIACGIVERAVLVRRFNGLVKVMQAPEPYARRLARHLARHRARTETRALARTPHHPHGKPPPMDAFVRRCQAAAKEGADDG